MHEKIFVVNYTFFFVFGISGVCTTTKGYKPNRITQSTIGKTLYSRNGRDWCLSGKLHSQLNNVPYKVKLQSIENVENYQKNMLSKMKC